MEKGIKISKIFRVMLAIVVIMGVALLMFACMDDKNQNAVLTPKSSDKFPEGTSISGENISGMSVDEAIELGRAHLEKVKNDLQISIKFKDDTQILQKDDFEYSDILDMQAADILKSGEAGNHEISYVLDLSSQGKQKIIDAAKTSYVAGVDATVDKYDNDAGAFLFKAGEKGSRADVDQTLKSVRQMLAQKTGGNLQASFMEVVPKMTVEELQSKFVKLSSYSTDSSNTSNGNSNMALALSRINGTVLNSGQIFSYNDSIGNSTSTADGYLPAGGIINGILVDVIGGGICQGSSTLYNAVIEAGLEITERECHSRASSYVPTGLDATVDYGNIDFKFRNNMDYPVYIMAWMDGVTLYTSIYGVQPEEWDSIEVYAETTGTYPALGTVSFVTDASMGAGQFEKRTSGNTGVQAVASRTFYKDGNVVKTEELPSSYYPPSGVIYACGPGTDTSKIDTSTGSGSTAPTPAPPAPTSPTPPAPVTPTPEGPVDNPTPTPVPPTPTPEPTPEPTPPPISWPDESIPEEG